VSRAVTLAASLWASWLGFGCTPTPPETKAPVAPKQLAPAQLPSEPETRPDSGPVRPAFLDLDVRQHGIVSAAAIATLGPVYPRKAARASCDATTRGRRARPPDIASRGSCSTRATAIPPIDAFACCARRGEREWRCGTAPAGYATDTVKLQADTLLLDERGDRALGVVDMDAWFHCAGQCESTRPLVWVDACGVEVRLRAHSVERPANWSSSGS